MYRFIVRGLAPLFTALCLIAFAGSASAQYDECTDPNSVPFDVFTTIVEESGFDFGDLSEGVCNSIAKQGEALCKSQVKASASCLSRSVDAVHSIAVKQCNQLEDPTERSTCKDDYKDYKQAAKDEIGSMKSDGLAVCAGEMADELLAACLDGIPL